VEVVSVATAGPAREVFDFWREAASHPKSLLSRKRSAAIRSRLKDGFSVDDLCRAVRGCLKSPHNMGKNDRGEVYDDIELICRDVEHVERFMARAGDGPASGIVTIGPDGEPRISDEEMARRQAEVDAWD